jgi:hypothetical protein
MQIKDFEEEENEELSAKNASLMRGIFIFITVRVIFHR